MQTARRSSQASFWHLQALEAVLNRVVQSVYPERGAREVKKYFDATFWPRQYDQEKEPLAIMWTHTNGGDALNFIPNHFVPLIPVDKMTYFRTEGELSHDKLLPFKLTNVCGEQAWKSKLYTCYDY